MDVKRGGVANFVKCTLMDFMVPGVLKCIICEEVFEAGATSDLRRHLAREHNLKEYERVTQLFLQTSPSPSAFLPFIRFPSVIPSKLPLSLPLMP